jgi:hypothetical protein
MAAVVPDYAGPRIGWRVWNVVEIDGDFRLSSLVYRTIWLPRSEVVARCRRPLAALPWERMPLHGPPNYDCLCGIYAVETPARALPYLTSRLAHGRNAVPRIMGLVSLWGRIVESEGGWRATYGYPALLVVPGREPVPGRGPARRLRKSLSPQAMASALADYAVPVHVVDDLCEGELISLARGRPAC